jgi:hypothetical protein
MIAPGSARTDQRLEVASAVLMALTTVATAWCAYQATLWGGEQTFRLSEVNAAGREASRLSLEAQQEMTIDAAIFLHYLEARTQNDQALTEFYSKRIPDFSPVLEAWAATNPFENPDAPPHPFGMPEYVREEAVQARQMERRATDRLDAAREANRISDAYVLNTVMLAMVLFFAGIATKFSTRHLKLMIVTLGGVVFAGGVVRIALLPISSG